MRLLVESGGDVDVVNGEGSSPLHWAARKDHASTVSLLLELGATRDLPNERGQTPMGYAKFLGMHAVIAVLEPDEGARKQAAIQGDIGRYREISGDIGRYRDEGARKQAAMLVRVRVRVRVRVLTLTSARKQAAMRAQRAAGDAAAKAEQEQRREQELQARTPSRPPMARSLPCRLYLAHISRTSRLYLPLQARKAAAKSRLDAKAKGKGTPTRKGKVRVRV